MPLATQPYKGARDFYPDEKRLQKYMFGMLRQTVERFGYEEYDAPILESFELYAAKSGQEIVNEQTYTFEDRGGRKVAIRPEMTPSVSRMVAAKRQELAYPLRWYSIPNLWRYERPQRGRLREHWQLNVDIFGLAGSQAEIEMITLVDAIFKAFRATPDMYAIKLNNRELVNFILEDYCGYQVEAAHNVAKLIDRMHKLDRSTFTGQLDELSTPQQRETGVIERLLAILDAKTLDELPKQVSNHAAAQQLATVLDQLTQSGITNIAFDASLMRGFDYYTGVVFEVFDTHPDNNRAMLGGGRYDGLVGLFGVEPVPTVGFGWGDVTLANFLEVHHLVPSLPSETHAYVALIGDTEAAAQPIIAKLRSHGVNLAVGAPGRKLGDHFKAAEKKGIRYAVIIGEQELASHAYGLKDLNSGDDQKLSLDEIAKRLQEPAA